MGGIASIYRDLYNSSIDDIRQLMYEQIQFEKMYRRHIYDNMGKIFKELLNNVKKAIVRIVKEHNETFQDDIDLRIVKYNLLDSKISVDMAYDILIFIEKTQLILTEWEADFVNNIFRQDSKYLSIHQSNILRTIYNKSVGYVKVKNNEN